MNLPELFKRMEDIMDDQLDAAGAANIVLGEVYSEEVADQYSEALGKAYNAAGEALYNAEKLFHLYDEPPGGWK